MIRLIQNLSVLVFLSGIILLVYYVTKTNNNCPSSKIKYKFLPRSFEKEQEDLPRPSNVFSDMFKLPSTWIGYSDINQESDENKDTESNVDKKSGTIDVKPAGSDNNSFAPVE